MKLRRFERIVTWIGVVALGVFATSCSETTDIYSSFDLERNELLNRMRIIERMYVWNNFKTVVEYPELISENVFERLPNEWRELKRGIRRNQFDDAYRIIKKEATDISLSLRYLETRLGFYEITRSFHLHYEDPEEAGWSNHIQLWFMMEYPVCGIDIE